jgi:hypothetical protein
VSIMDFTDCSPSRGPTSLMRTSGGLFERIGEVRKRR